ncbi:ABC transporter substrate-binding protein [Limobrevibacterium gyesilva]|nr:ABC transporter substrate-binding protein [Limobrevibacterium gyesilva]
MDARLGVQTETSSIDPHYALVGANQTVAQHIFETLLTADAAMRPAAGLAASWRAVGDDAWEFRLRPGARFHDGTPVTAEDVRFSLERMPHVPGSPAPFVRLAGITTAIEVEGSDIVRLRTKGFDPSVPLNAMSAWIVSGKAARDATTADFNSGRAAIGSGPWRFVEWKPGERLVLERFDPSLPFERAVIRPMSNDAARLAALLAGDVDLIDSVPPGDIEKLRGNPAVKLWTAPSARLIYLALDQEHDTSPQLRGMDGKPLAANPLKDARVRRALSLAINRTLIVDRLLHGAGHSTGQMVPEGFIGHDPSIVAPDFDPAAAKQLLAEAGWGQGFRLTLTSPNNRYVEDAKTAQAVAQQWTRAGIGTEVDVLPSNAFFSRAAKREFAAFLIGFGSTAGDAYTAMSQVLNSYDAERGLGALNRFRFSDPAVDAALERSQGERDPAARTAALQAAARIALVQDTAIIPLHFPDNAWATRAGFSYRPTMAEGAQAALLRPAP